MEPRSQDTFTSVYGPQFPSTTTSVVIYLSQYSFIACAFARMNELKRISSLLNMTWSIINRSSIPAVHHTPYWQTKSDTSLVTQQHLNLIVRLDLHNGVFLTLTFKPTPFANIANLSSFPAHTFLKVATDHQRSPHLSLHPQHLLDCYFTFYYNDFLFVM